MSRLGPLPAQFFSPTLYENHRDDASQIAPLPRISHLAASTPVAADADADDHNGQQQIKAAGKSKTSCTEIMWRMTKMRMAHLTNHTRIWPF